MTPDATGTEYVELIQQAMADYDGLRLGDALRNFEAAQALQPDSYEASVGLARTYTRMRRERDAYAAAQRCIELAPERPEGYTVLGVLHFLTDRLDEAVQALTKAIELAPEEIEPYLTRAQVYADLKRFDQAHIELEHSGELIDALPEEALRRQMRASALHAETYVLLAENKQAEASERAQEIMGYEADNPYAACLAYSNLGLMEARNQHYNEAVSYLERALSMNPFFYRAGGALGRILLVQNKAERAAEVLGKVVEIAPEIDAHTRHAYAAALAKARHREEALQQYRLALGAGLKGLEAWVARWNVAWLHPVGRYVIIAVAMAAVAVWLLVGRPSPEVLTFAALLVLILFLQRTLGNRRR